MDVDLRMNRRRQRAVRRRDSLERLAPYLPLASLTVALTALVVAVTR